jgi:hypothetical protein
METHDDDTHSPMDCGGPTMRRAKLAPRVLDKIERSLGVYWVM